MQHNITGRLWTIQELQLLWGQEMTVGELLRLFCLVQCNVLHLHTFVWYDFWLCVVYVQNNLMVENPLKQHQCESVPKCSSFSVSSSFPFTSPSLAEKNSSLKIAHKLFFHSHFISKLMGSVLPLGVFHIQQSVHKSRSKQCALVYSLSQEEHYKAFFLPLQSNNAYKYFSQVNFNAPFGTWRHLFGSAPWGWALAVWGTAKLTAH